HRLLVLPLLEEGRPPRPPHGRVARRRAGRRGPQPAAVGGDHRQPVGQDDGKGGPRGIDAFKKVSGRKRHILVDTIGLILAVVVTPASVQDDAGAKLVFESIRGRFGRLKLVRADSIYKRVADWVSALRPAEP